MSCAGGAAARCATLSRHARPAVSLGERYMEFFLIARARARARTLKAFPGSTRARCASPRRSLYRGGRAAAGARSRAERVASSRLTGGGGGGGRRVEEGARSGEFHRTRRCNAEFEARGTLRAGLFGERLKKSTSFGRLFLFSKRCRAVDNEKKSSEVAHSRNFIQRDQSSLTNALVKTTINKEKALLTLKTLQFSIKSSHLPDQLRNALPLNSLNASVGDRFIPRRRDVNLDVSHFYHTRRSSDEKDRVYLNVVGEIKQATESWRKRYMDIAFKSQDIFSGMQSRRVLNIGEPLASSFRKIRVQEFSDDYQWDCRPRKQPLMSMKAGGSRRYRDHGAQIFRFALTIKMKNLIDWSKKNILAAGLAETVCICDIDLKNLSKVYKIEYMCYISCIKWNDAGTQLCVCGMDGTTTLYDALLSTIPWSDKWIQACPCYQKYFKRCKVNIIVWAKKDQHVITACSGGRLTIINAMTGDVYITKNFEREIMAMSISPNDQHLVVSCNDKLVKLFYYPNMMQLFEIAFFACVKAVAWHPWTSGVLCVGGGPGDAAISLWNVNSQRQLGFRKVTFLGSVDSIMFNRLSGELLVHWFYLEEDQLRSRIVVLAGLDKVVDAVPIQPEHKMLNIVWGPDHTKLAMQHRDTMVVWNFFGNEFEKWSKDKKIKPSKESKNNLRNYFSETSNYTGPYTTVANAKRGKDFAYYNIR